MQNSPWQAYQPKKSTLVAEWVLEKIRSQVYPEGAKLPSEREIARTLGMSRPPVREALSALQIARIVEIRPGNGTYVKSATPANEMVSNTMSVLEDSESPFEVMQARCVLEEGIIKVAATQATGEDMVRLEQALARMGDAVEHSDLSRYFQSNREFHLAVATATHNSVLRKLLESLLLSEKKELWQESIQRYLSDPEHIKKYTARHERILQAIEKRDVDKAAQEMTEHFSGTVEEVREYL
ncbi:FadR family transcriptional regulator [Candidatus Bipolaricaulota bacterium]|nr:FadR family transcriptional regulator [Candidatus Bipolaricaulota bacterium]